MSAFNTLVPIDPVQYYLLGLAAVVPERGRFRYAWLSKDYKQLHVLFRDGETSWSETKEETKKYIRSHPFFVSLEDAKYDSTYIIATFKYPEHCVEQIMKLDNLEKFTIDPFDLFETRLHQMRTNTLPPDIKEKVIEFAMKIQEALDSGETIIKV